MHKINLLLLLFVLITLTSCSTYYMTPIGLKEQLQSVDSTNIYETYDFRLGLAGVALNGGKNFYNGLDSIKCIDKRGDEILLPVNTQTGIRLTDETGKRVILYFDSLFLKDNLLYGSKSHFITLPVAPLNIDKLTKIEIQ